MPRRQPKEDGDVDLPAAPLDPRTIDRCAPLRLAVAAELAFPFGGMTASGLRKEAARGNLAIERIAGKDFVTLAAIEEMRERCRTPAKAQGSTPGSTRPSAAQLEIARDAARAIVERLSAGLPITSPKNTGRRAKAT